MATPLVGRWQWGRWGSVGDDEAATATAEEGVGGGAEIGVLLLPGVGWVLSSICDEKAGHSGAVRLSRPIAKSTAHITTVLPDLSWAEKHRCTDWAGPTHLP